MFEFMQRYADNTLARRTDNQKLGVLLGSTVPKQLDRWQRDGRAPPPFFIKALGKRISADEGTGSLYWVTRARTEKLLIGLLEHSADDLKPTIMEALQAVGFVRSLRPLIALMANPSLGRSARSAVIVIGERLAKVKDWPPNNICPRCGSTDNKEGNATGWECKTCGLRYRPRGERSPLESAGCGGVFGAFHGGPWDRATLVALVTEITAAAPDSSSELVAGWMKRCEAAISHWDDLIAESSRDR
jgi:hypothetical protein